MNINWNEIPTDVVCLVAYSDYSGVYLCTINDTEKLVTYSEHEPVCLTEDQLLAINPNVSLKAFGKAISKSLSDLNDELLKENCELLKEMEKIKNVNPC